MSGRFHHVPVLASEVVAVLAPPLAEGGLLVDCTVGGAGHASAILAAAPRASLLGLDRDPVAIAAAGDHLAGEAGRIVLVRASFGDLSGVLAQAGARHVRAVLYDLGVSSPHLDDPARGFGFRADGPLDMRMDASSGQTAADVVNTYSATELARVLSRYGEERFARRIAGAIVARRAHAPFTTTADLAEVVRDAIPAATRRTGGHPARRTFQALRIEVNDELGQLERSLPAAIEALEPGGRVAVISYHSLEDRIAKRTFVAAAQGCTCPPDLPVCACGAHATLRLLGRRATEPSAGDVADNPRARSARLRAAERLAPGEAA